MSISALFDAIIGQNGVGNKYDCGEGRLFVAFEFEAFSWHCQGIFELYPIKHGTHIEHMAFDIHQIEIPKRNSKYCSRDWN